MLADELTGPELEKYEREERIRKLGYRVVKMLLKHSALDEAEEALLETVSDILLRTRLAEPPVNLRIGPVYSMAQHVAACEAAAEYFRDRAEKGHRFLDSLSPRPHRAARRPAGRQ